MRPAASKKKQSGHRTGRRAASVTLLGRIIGKAGYTSFGTASGPECLSLLSRIEPRLVLLDVQMPDMDGYETCRQIRKDARLVRVPIAFSPRSSDAGCPGRHRRRRFHLQAVQSHGAAQLHQSLDSAAAHQSLARPRHPRVIADCISLKGVTTPRRPN
jgi:CheY-like chemotaxis protein